MLKKRKSKKFTGILAKPMKELPEPKNQMLMLMDGEFDAVRAFRERQIAHISSEGVRRVRALIQHYGIETGTRVSGDILLELVFAMAEDFGIPGFRTVHEHHRTGRKTTWGAAQQLALLDCVAQEKRRRKKSSALSACMRLAAPGARYARYKGDSLYRIYQKAKKNYPEWEELRASRYWDEIQSLALGPKNQ